MVGLKRSPTKQALKRPAAAKVAPEASVELPNIPRKPSRGRGFERYMQLVRATEELLNEARPDEIGLYQIAERAGVPASSIYHFFSTKEAAFVALAEHYVAQLAGILSQPMDAASLKSWLDVQRIDMERAMAFQNANPPLMKIFYGGYSGVSLRDLEYIWSNEISSRHYVRISKIFHLPKIENVEEVYEMRLAILDSIWKISYRRHGEVTRHYLEEAYNAVVLFMGQFLPSRVARRECLIEAAGRGEQISLPISSDEGE